MFKWTLRHCELTSMAWAVNTCYFRIVAAFPECKSRGAHYIYKFCPLAKLVVWMNHIVKFEIIVLFVTDTDSKNAQVQVHA